MTRIFFLLLLLLATVPISTRAAMLDLMQEDERAERELDLYESGTDAIEERQWQDAIRQFDAVIAMKGKRADGALYWRAFAEDRSGRTTDALNTLAELSRAHPSSRWIADAKALEVEMRGRIGRPVTLEAEADEDLRLLALGTLMHGNPERTLPALEKYIQGETSPQMRERALFLLAQHDSPRAREILLRYAKGEANPDLQRHAIRLIGIHGGDKSLESLESLYGSLSDRDARVEVIRALGIGGALEVLLRVTRSEKDPVIRGEAIQQLGVQGAGKELAALYAAETSVAVKERILNALFVSDASEELERIARTEKNPDLRAEAVRKIGISGNLESGGTLLAIYQADPAMRSAVVDALFIQSNAGALVRLARQEKDPQLKREIVHKLSLLDSDEGQDYLMEILTGKP